MRNASLWRALLSVEKTVIEDIEFDEDAEVVVAHVRPPRASKGRCGSCGSRAAWYDRGEGRRRWRGLDLGTVEVFLEADAPRVNCLTHGPTVRQVPWARHGAGHTLAFDQQVAWLATKSSKSAITELMRIAWRTVGAIITRVWADTASELDLFAGLRRIGIDEISYKRSHKYLTVVVDHDVAGWCGPAPGATAPRSRSSSTPWKPPAKEDPPRSPTSPPTARTGSPTSCAAAAHKQSAAPTRSTSSAGRPMPSMPCAATPGTRHAAQATLGPTDGQPAAESPSPPGMLEL